MTETVPTPSLAPLVQPREYTAAEVADNRAQLVAALRSGDYAQAFGTLRRSTVNESGHGVTLSHCCLGVVETLRGCVWSYVPVGDDGQQVENPWQADSPGFSDVDDTNRAVTTLSVAGMAWLGVDDTDPDVVVWDHEDGSWKTTTLSAVNDEPQDFNHVADVLERQPADWVGDYHECVRRADRWNAEGYTWEDENRD
jgi:hypothetical protein